MLISLIEIPALILFQLRKNPYYCIFFSLTKQTKDDEKQEFKAKVYGGK